MPDTVDPDRIEARIKRMRAEGRVMLEGKHPVAFKERTDMLFLRRETLPFHTNGVRLSAFDEQGTLLEERRYFSVGGGFVVSQEEADASADHPRLVVDAGPVLEQSVGRQSATYRRYQALAEVLQRKLNQCNNIFFIFWKCNCQRPLLVN